jgi:DNA-directed RNA polymerase specialized sigma24 family protein
MSTLRTSSASAAPDRKRWSDWRNWKTCPTRQAASEPPTAVRLSTALMNLIQHLKPLDRHVILSYLEGLDAASIGEITGRSPGNVATKIHRIKTVLARQFQQGDH